MMTPSDPAALTRLLAMIDEALALSDTLDLHATGIALDTARLSVAAVQQAGGPGPMGADVAAPDLLRNGSNLRGRR